MKIHVTKGDVYVFHGAPACVRHLAECLSCARRPPYPGPREFVDAGHRDTWVLAHQTHWPQHEVKTSTEVTA